MNRRAMNRRALRRQIKERRAAIKARQAAVRKQAAQTPAARAARARRRRILLLILLLLLLLTRCMADEALPTLRLGVGAPPSKPAVVASQAPPSRAPAPAKKPRRRLKRIKTPARERWQTPPPRPAPWLATFRMQVSARSPRLARCFEGQREPGALRWQATVDPATGGVSDQRFDTRLAAPTDRCLRAVLADPPYRLTGGAGAVPITLLIEF